MVQLKERIKPKKLLIEPDNNPPIAIAKVKAAEMIPTCPLLSPSPFCQTVIVAESPTIIPDPKIDPIPAAAANGRYCEINCLLLSM